MHETKTVQVIKTLTKGELDGLKHFLNNPYFNKNGKIKILFEFIYSFSPGFKGTNFTKVKATKKVFPNEEFDQKQINHILNLLNAKIDKFVSFLELNQDTVESELKVLEYHQRRDTKFFENQLKRIEKLLKNVKGRELLEINQRIEYLLATHYSTTQPYKERNLNVLLNALDSASMFTKLYVICEMLNHSLITNYSYDFKIEKLLNYVDSMQEVPMSLNLLKTASQTLYNVSLNQSIDLGDYFAFKNQLFLEKDVLNIEELSNLLTYLRTVFNRTNFADEQYYQEHFSLYQFGLESEIYLARGSLSTQIIKNLITVSVRADQVDWLESFLTNYKKHFPKDQAKELEAYCLACVQFERKEYKNVLKSLEGWEFNDIFLNLGKRILTIKTFYELENIELFEARINNLNRILSYYKKNKKLSDNYSEVYLSFRSMVLSTYKLIRRETEKINRLEQKIQSIPHNKLPEKKWLLQKLNEKR